MTLYIIPTPIGNLGDITVRALECLKSVDAIACEDTRQTKKLLNHYSIKKPLISFHDHSGNQKTQKIVEMLIKGQSVALVSDSGTPLISDPGFPLVREALKRDIRIEALPGACAIISALASSGLSVETFSFWGFMPPKSAGRLKKLEELKSHEETLVFYESPYRVVKALENMLEALGDREVVVARELTKKFEEIKRGHLSDMIKYFTNKTPKGEFVMMVAGSNRKEVLS